MMTHKGRCGIQKNWGRKAKCGMRWPIDAPENAMPPPGHPRQCFGCNSTFVKVIHSIYGFSRLAVSGDQPFPFLSFFTVQTNLRITFCTARPSSSPFSLLCFPNSCQIGDIAGPDCLAQLDPEQYFLSHCPDDTFLSVFESSRLHHGCG